MKKFIIIIITLLLIYFLLHFSHGFKVEDIKIGDFFNLFGILILSYVALFQDEFKSWWRAPILKIDFKPEAPFCYETPLYIWYASDNEPKKQITTKAYAFNFSISNIGKTQAKLCEMFISDLEEYKADRWQRVDFFQTVNLKWGSSKSENAYLDINPSQIQLLGQIGSIVKDNIPGKPTNVFWISYLYRIGGNQPEYLSPSTKYRFKITAVSENAKSVSKNFELLFTGKCGNSLEETLKEITISSSD